MLYLPITYDTHVSTRQEIEKVLGQKASLMMAPDLTQTYFGSQSGL